MEIFQSPNILNWYPFNKTQKVLEVGNKSEELTKFLIDKCSSIQKISKIEELENIDAKFDIIILIGINENEKINLKNLVRRLEAFLEMDGRILLAVDNKFGLRFWAGNPENILEKKFTSLLGYNNEYEKIETYTKRYIETQLNEIGYKTRFYYPLPDYRRPNVIFSDDALPEYNSIDKYNPYYTGKSDILFNEIDVFREILKTDKDMFTFFANSFLVEVIKKEKEYDTTYNYISYNNLRKEKYRLITKISNTYVEKQIVNEKAEEHYENIKNNIKILQENNIKTVDYIDEDKIKSKYIEQKYLLNNVLTEKLEKGQVEEFDNIIKNYIKQISVKTYKENNYENTAFGKYRVEVKDKSIIQDLNFVKNGMWDMTFKNCFLIDNQFYFFDQEWNEPNLPVEYILYRAILYTISLRRFVSIEELFDKYNLSKYITLFEQLDNKIQEEIRDDEVWKFYSQNHDFNIDGTKQELKNLQIRSEAQQTEINNLNERFNAQQLENNNLKENNKLLQEELNKSNKERERLQTAINNTFLNKVKRKIKKIVK